MYLTIIKCKYNIKASFCYEKNYVTKSDNKEEATYNLGISIMPMYIGCINSKFVTTQRFRFDTEFLLNKEFRITNV